MTIIVNGTTFSTYDIARQTIRNFFLRRVEEAESLKDKKVGKGYIDALSNIVNVSKDASVLHDIYNLKDIEEIYSRLLFGNSDEASSILSDATIELLMVVGNDKFDLLTTHLVQGILTTRGFTAANVNKTPRRELTDQILKKAILGDSWLVVILLLRQTNVNDDFPGYLNPMGLDINSKLPVVP